MLEAMSSRLPTDNDVERAATTLDVASPSSKRHPRDHGGGNPGEMRIDPIPAQVLASSRDSDDRARCRAGVACEHHRPRGGRDQ